jgi:hypothetical protein
MTTLGTTALATEILEGTMLTLEQMTTRLTVLALNASRNQEQSSRVRMLLGDLLADIQDCEEQLGTYARSTWILALESGSLGAPLRVPRCISCFIEDPK